MLNNKHIALCFPLNVWIRTVQEHKHLYLRTCTHKYIRPLHAYTCMYLRSSFLSWASLFFTSVFSLTFCLPYSFILLLSASLSLFPFSPFFPYLHFFQYFIIFFLFTAISSFFLPPSSLYFSSFHFRAFFFVLTFLSYFHTLFIYFVVPCSVLFICFFYFFCLPSPANTITYRHTINPNYYIIQHTSICVPILKNSVSNCLTSVTYS